MRVMVLVKATPSSEAGVLPDAQLMHEMGTFNEQLVAAGIMKAGDGLKATSHGARVRFSGPDRTVIDGPFTETKELVAGYWLWEVESLEQAIDWVKRCPNPMPEDSEIEIRPLFEAADFAELDPTGELMQQEEVMREAVAMQEAEITVYLFYGGRCEEAIEFYKNAAGAISGYQMRFSDSPEPAPEGLISPEFNDKIMHSEMRIGKTRVMMSDGCNTGDRVTSTSGFRLALTVPTPDDAHRVFILLSEGGKVDMPLEPTFWSPLYGQLTDKFGIGWMVMVAGPAA